MNDNTKLEQKTEISETTSKGITSLRYLLSVLIVLHTAFKKGHWSVEKGTFGAQKRTA